MAEIIRNRTIRPSTRLEKSKSYKIDTKKVSHNDILIVNIDHETKPFRKTYRFKGSEVAHKDSISFRVNDFETSIDVSWGGVIPIAAASTKAMVPKSSQRKKTVIAPIKIKSQNSKTSFDPISNEDTEILILGTLPGDKSIELGEYYAHPRNRFWKVISTITNNKIPLTYSDKKKLLLKSKIGIWDVAHKADRKGSLDSAIENEDPNDLENFIAQHKSLKIIGFNGKKSELLFNKYFSRENSLKYISLPSTSPANTGIEYDKICKLWRQLVTN